MSPNDQGESSVLIVAGATKPTEKVASLSNIKVNPSLSMPCDTQELSEETAKFYVEPSGSVSTTTTSPDRKSTMTDETLLDATRRPPSPTRHTQRSGSITSSISTTASLVGGSTGHPGPLMVARSASASTVMLGGHATSTRTSPRRSLSPQRRAGAMGSVPRHGGSSGRIVFDFMLQPSPSFVEAQHRAEASPSSSSALGPPCDACDVEHPNVQVVVSPTAEVDPASTWKPHEVAAKLFHGPYKKSLITTYLCKRYTFIYIILPCPCFAIDPSLAHVLVVKRMRKRCVAS